MSYTAGLQLNGTALVLFIQLLENICPYNSGKVSRNVDVDVRPLRTLLKYSRFDSHCNG